MMALKTVAATSRAPRHRRAVINLGTNYGHSLTIEFGPVSATLSRDRVERLGDALAGVTDERALQLLSAFQPGFKLDDVAVLRRVIGEFEDEMISEDRRPEPRSHKFPKTIQI